VRRHGYGESHTGGKYFEINCSFVSFDGVRVGIASHKLRIWDRKEFFGPFSTSITSLSAFPLKFLDERERSAIEEAMAERGKRYLKTRQMCVMQYNGLLLYLKRPPLGYYNENAGYGENFICKLEYNF